MQPVDRIVIAHLISGAAPERRTELSGLWEQYKPTFELQADSVGSIFSAARNRIRWSYKTIAHDWLISFAAWHVFCAYSPAIVAAQITTGELTEELLSSDAGLQSEQDIFDDLLYFARELRRAVTLEQVSWPPSVPEPTDDRENLDVAGKAAFDLACISSAACFLHELRHVQFAANCDAPLSALDEERMCDNYSREFLLDGVDAYCRCSGQDRFMVMSKRIMGLTLAAYIIDEGTPRDLHAGLADSHPPAAERFRELALKGEAPADADCWIYMASLLLASHRRFNRMPRHIAFSSGRDLCERLLESFNQMAT